MYRVTRRRWASQTLVRLNYTYTFCSMLATRSFVSLSSSMYQYTGQEVLWQKSANEQIATTLWGMLCDAGGILGNILAVRILIN